MPSGSGDQVGSRTIRGRDAQEFGMFVTASVGSTLAAAMTAGAREKAPPPTDINEDACAIVASGRTKLLVVADAHGGCEASELAVASVLDSFGENREPAAEPSEAFLDVIYQAGIAVQRGTSRGDCPHPDSRTTLAFALLTDDAVLWGSFGDSMVIVASALETAELNRRRPAYLGHPFSRAEVSALGQSGRRRLQPGERVILATDGLAELPDGSEWRGVGQTQFAETTVAAGIARGLLECALAESVADAVTVAVATTS
jgi:serine/threonine protein phosphatase PrpC